MVLARFWNTMFNWAWLEAFKTWLASEAQLLTRSTRFWIEVFSWKLIT